MCVPINNIMPEQICLKLNINVVVTLLSVAFCSNSLITNATESAEQY
jgi:hypothetical protein